MQSETSAEQQEAGKNASEREIIEEQQQGREENLICDTEVVSETVAETNASLPKQPNPEHKGINLFFIGFMYVLSVFFCTVIYQYVPMIGYVAIWLVPVIFALQTVSYGVISSGITLVCCMLLTEAFFHGALAFQVCIHYSLLGIALGICFRKKYKGSAIFLIVTVVYLLMIGLVIYWPFRTYAPSMYQIGTAMVYRIFNGLYWLCSSVSEMELLSMGIPIGAYEQFMQMMTALMLPAGFICYCGFRVFVIYLLTVFILRAFGEPVIPLPPFTTWRMPSFVFWLFIAGAVSGILTMFFDSIWLAFIFVNIFYVTLPLFGVSGLALFCYYLRNSEMAKILKWLIGICCVFFLSVSGLLWTALGILDSLFHLRQPRSHRLEKEVVLAKGKETLTAVRENKNIEPQLTEEPIDIETSNGKIE